VVGLRVTVEMFRDKVVKTLGPGREIGARRVGRSGEALRRADDLVQDAKAHVSAALRVGQEAIRPAPP
jgi:hypothetical protein